MMARTPRNTGANSPRPSAGSRSAVGTRIARSRHRAGGVVRVVVARGEHEKVVEFVTSGGHALDEPRAQRPLAVEPLQFVVERMLPREDMRGTPAEILGVTLFGDGKAFDGDTVHAFDADRKLVAPRHVVSGAGRQHAHLGVARHMLGDVPGVQLGAPADIGAVPLDDDTDLH